MFSSYNNHSDPAVKQILLLMNEKESFIIEDLDEYHLVIKAEQEYRVRKELEVEVRYVQTKFARHSSLIPALVGEKYIQFRDLVLLIRATLPLRCLATLPFPRLSRTTARKVTLKFTTG